MKKLLLTTAAIFLSSPAFAWHPIVIYNKTDPFIIGVTFRDTSINPVDPVVVIVDVPVYQFRVFGPLPEIGPCLRTVDVDIFIAGYGHKIVTSQTQMDVCNEGWIIVAPQHIPYQHTNFVVTHGQGSGPSGPPGGGVGNNGGHGFH